MTMADKECQGQMKTTENPYEGRWKYVGKHGPSIYHKVVWIDPEDGMIYTWSDPLKPLSRDAGFSWMGEAHQFMCEFTR